MANGERITTRRLNRLLKTAGTSLRARHRPERTWPWHTRSSDSGEGWAFRDLDAFLRFLRWDWGVYEIPEAWIARPQEETGG